MKTNESPTSYKEAYCARVKALRVAHGSTAAEMAALLGIPAERYRKYENRSPMPQYLVDRFAVIVGKTINYVLTGEERRSPQKKSA